MRIEEAIQQVRPFKNEHNKAVVNLLYTSNWLRDRIKAVLKPYQLTNQQFNVLRILKGAKEPLSTSIIRERLLDKMADTSRLVNRLEQKGLVFKNSCPKDKRLVDIHLTEKGLSLLSQINEEVEQSNNNSLHLTSEEAKQLSLLLDKARG